MSNDLHTSARRYRASAAVFAVLALGLALSPGLPSQAAPTVGGVVEGSVYRDYDATGTRQASEPGEPGIDVAVACMTDNGVDGTVGTADDVYGATVTATSGDDGTWSVTAPGSPCRVEFTIPAAKAHLAPGAAGGTSVQFVEAPAAGVDFTVNNPTDFCQSNPTLATTCFEYGPTTGANSAAAAIRTFANSATGDYPASGGGAAAATFGQVGAVWGMAPDTANGGWFAAAFVKRHSGLAAAPGTIFRVPAAGSGGSITTLVTLDAGSDPHPANGAANSEWLRDANSWDAVGKTGLGDIDVSEDGSTLYAINLFDRTLNSIPIADPAARTSVSIPAPATCPDADWRPFGLGVQDGQIYVGGVCTNQSTQVVDANFAAHVYRAPATSPGSFTTVLTFPFDGTSYPRKCADPIGAGTANTSASDNTNDLPNRTCAAATAGGLDNANWVPWRPVAAPTTFPSGRPRFSTPWLTDIEFTADGNMALGLRSRFGDQVGNGAYAPGGSDTTLHQGIGMGDLLKACLSGGTWVLESNGSCGGAAGGGVGSFEGPGGGEFFNGDDQYYHDQLNVGGVTSIKVNDEIATTMFDPYPAQSEVDDGGVSWQSGTTGVRSKSYRVFNGSGGAQNQFGKANGLGDLEALCDLAPIEIGNRVWFDTNDDGQQDAGESPAAGVTVELWSGTTLVGTTVTTGDGTYLFGGITNAGMIGGNEVLPETDYEVRIPDAQGPAAQSPLAGYAPTDPDVGSNTTDSDGVLTGTTAVATVTTGTAGRNDHTYDFGFVALEPSIDIEKWSTDDGIIGGDFDTSPGKELVTGETESISFTITNDGTEALVDLVVGDTTGSGPAIGFLTCDFSPLGGPATGLTWAGPFDPLDQFTCTGELPPLAVDTTHSDTATVSAVGDVSEEPVDDEDPWFGTTPPAPLVPAIDIEKWSTTDGNPAGDFDASPGKELLPDTDEAITFTITNDGTEPLVDVLVSDVTSDGPDLTGLSCDFTALGGPAAGVTWAGPFAPATSFDCTATLPGMAPGTQHTDLAAVVGTGATSGTEVDDDDPWNGFTADPPPVPGIDIEKYSTDQGFPAGDFDVLPGKELDEGVDEALTFSIENTGEEALVDVVVTDATTTGGDITGLSCDFSPLGGPATGTTWSGPFLVGSVFYCTATLPGMAFEAQHADTATVVGTGEITGGGVTDDDDWASYVDEAPPVPMIDIEKWSTADGADDGDFDAAPGKTVVADTDESITFTILNNGTEALLDVVVSDVTSDGPDLTDISCDFSALGGPATGTAWAGPFAPAATFDCTATLPGMAPGSAHSDTASVSGVGEISGTDVADDDPWFGQTAPPIPVPDIDIEKWSTADGDIDGDHDTVPGKELATGVDEPISFTIINTGEEALLDVTVTDGTDLGPDVTGLTCDFSPFGGPATGTTWAGPFVVGESFECTATLPGMLAETQHSDTATVVGTGEVSGNGVSDEDEWHGFTPVAPAPAIDIEKWSTVDGALDGDFDAAPGKELATGSAEALSFTVVNTGNEDLVDVVVSDATGDGPDITGLTCDFSLLGGPISGTTWAGPFGPGASFGCTATLPAMAGGTAHSDTATVTATGDGSDEPVTDDDPWFGETPIDPVPAIDIEKWSTVDGIVAGDFDVAPGKELAVGVDEAVTFSITNTGTEDLVNVSVSDATDTGPDLTGVSCDFSGLGGPATGTTWAGPFLVDDSFDCTATLPGLAVETGHTDTASVVAVGATSQIGVTDDDPWNAFTPGAPPVPAVSIEKYSSLDGFPAGDFDAAPGKELVAGIDEGIVMTITNTGTEDLTDVVVSDATGAGPDVTGLSCDFSPLGGPASGTTWAGPFVVGDSFDCTATLPGLAVDQAHADTATVLGIGQTSLTTVTDDDPWNAFTPPAPLTPAIDIEKWSTVDGIVAGDFDAAPGKELVSGVDEAVSFTITNGGTEALTGIVVSDNTDAGPSISTFSCDFSPLGGPNTGTTWAGPFLIGTSFTCTATLPGMADSTSHADTATVVGIGQTSQTTVTDADPWNAFTGTPTTTTTTTLPETTTTVPDTTTTTVPETTTTVPETTTTVPETTTTVPETTTTAPETTTTVPETTTTAPETTTTVPETTTTVPGEPTTTTLETTTTVPGETTTAPSTTVPGEVTTVPTTVLGETTTTEAALVPITTEPDGNTSPTLVTRPATSNDDLARTGTDMGQLGAAAVSLILCGVCLLLGDRRRTMAVVAATRRNGHRP